MSAVGWDKARATGLIGWGPDLLTLSLLNPAPHSPSPALLPSHQLPSLRSQTSALGSETLRGLPLPLRWRQATVSVSLSTLLWPYPKSNLTSSLLICGPSVGLEFSDHGRYNPTSEHSFSLGFHISYVSCIGRRILSHWTTWESQYLDTKPGLLLRWAFRHSDCNHGFYFFFFLSVIIFYCGKNTNMRATLLP